VTPHIPVRGWKHLAARVRERMKADDVPLLAAGVAFYGLLSLVPALVVLVSVYGLIADPEGIEDDIEDLLAAAPEEVQDLVTSQLSAIVESSPSSLRVGGAVVGVVVALWSASSAVRHLIGAVNLAYRQLRPLQRNLRRAGCGHRRDAVAVHQRLGRGRRRRDQRRAGAASRGGIRHRTEYEGGAPRR
jgi:uncharacterized BrkB/YihY/UPF0761 family membrane protein